MEREQAATELPVTYQRMLEMLAGGQSEHEIAEGLGIDPYAVRSMIRLAEAKLARLADGTTLAVGTTLADGTTGTAATTIE